MIFPRFRLKINPETSGIRVKPGFSYYFKTHGMDYTTILNIFLKCLVYMCPVSFSRLYGKNKYSKC